MVRSGQARPDQATHLAHEFIDNLTDPRLNNHHLMKMSKLPTVHDASVVAVSGSGGADGTPTPIERIERVAYTGGGGVDNRGVDIRG